MQNPQSQKPSSIIHVAFPRAAPFGPKSGQRLLCDSVCRIFETTLDTTLLKILNPRCDTGYTSFAYDGRFASDLNTTSLTHRVRESRKFCKKEYKERNSLWGQRIKVISQAFNQQWCSSGCSSGIERSPWNHSDSLQPEISTTAQSLTPQQTFGVKKSGLDRKFTLSALVLSLRIHLSDIASPQHSFHRFVHSLLDV